MNITVYLQTYNYLRLNEKMHFNNFKYKKYLLCKISENYTKIYVNYITHISFLQILNTAKISLFLCLNNTIVFLHVF